MRNATNIVVQRAIVHIINNRENEPFLSDGELPLNERQSLREYFSSQVVNVLRDSQTGSALFSTDAEPAAAAECFRILNDDNSFIPASQELARQLFDAMKGDKRIVPGSLVVSVYTADNYPSISFLALIKIDPARALVQEVIKRDGKKVVSFKENDLVMPTTKEKLHKAALIPPKGRDKSFDLLLLDRQVSAVAADFFAYKFLHSIPARDPKDMTDDFYLGVLNAYNRLVGPPAKQVAHVTPRAAESFRDHIDVALQSPYIDIDEWIDKLPFKEDAKIVVREEIERKLPRAGSSGRQRQEARRVGLGLVYQQEAGEILRAGQRP